MDDTPYEVTVTFRAYDGKSWAKTPARVNAAGSAQFVCDVIAAVSEAFHDQEIQND